MKVVSELNGLVVFLVPTEEVYPKEGVHLPDVMNAIALRYNFTSWTDFSRVPPEEIEKKEIQFRIGRFVSAPGRESIIKQFVVNEGSLVASSYNTSVAEDFIGDVLRSLSESYDFRSDPLVGRTMLVLSELLVEFDEALDKALSNFESISRMLEVEFLKHYGREEKYKLDSIALDFQRLFAAQPISNLSRFTIERRVNTSFGENKYYCRAPFRTLDHIQLLEGMERSFKG